jgi:hypothetical protein
MRYIIQHIRLPELNYLNKVLGRRIDVLGTDDPDFVVINIPDEWLPEYQELINSLKLQEADSYTEQVAGKVIVNDVLRELKALTVVQAGQIFNTITPVMITLLAGNLRAARQIASTIATTTVYTTARRTWLVNTIQSEINKL